MDAKFSEKAIQVCVDSVGGDSQFGADRKFGCIVEQAANDLQLSRGKLQRSTYQRPRLCSQHPGAD